MADRGSPVVLHAGNASEWTGPTGTNTYLLRGAVPALVDAGIGDPQHIDAIAGALDGEGLALILVTHAHPDHAGGIPALRERWPRAVVRGAGSHPLGDGEVVRAGDGLLRALHTPGHAPDHVCFHDETTGDAYCGDLVRLGGTVVIPARRGGDLRAYLASLSRLASLGPRRLFPGHGPVVDDPAALIDQYLAHRAARERQIVEALGAGRRTLDDIVPRIYGTLSPLLAGAAAENVLAHLQKLAVEGRVDEVNGAWNLRDR
jgi:glyoxylase-like metal-dependent hydrolase (beta-lactamase superfamily II)